MLENPALTIVHQGFIDTKNYMHLGIIIGAYRIFGLATMLIAFNVMVSGNLQTSFAAVNIYSVILPVCVIIYDR